jgi:hypothetical protein
MGIGASVFLIALGAILTFALNIELSGLDIDAVGIILMIMGLVGLLMTLVVWGPLRPGRTRVVEERPIDETQIVEERTTTYPRPVQERRIYEDPGPL